MINLVIYDFKVFVHKINNILVKHEPLIKSISKREGVLFLKKQEKVAKGLWLYYLNRGPDMLPSFTHIPLVVDDVKPYWRSFYFPDYKGGRSEKTKEWYSTENIGLRYINSRGFSYISRKHYEADDIAGSIVKMQKLAQITNPSNKDINILKNLHIYLYTVDSDWLQLTSDTVDWCNTGPWIPRLRGVEETKEWAKKRLKFDIRHPQDIVAIKSMKGDKSDNLPPGTKPYFIDLINTHKDHSLVSDPSFVSEVMSKLKHSPSEEDRRKDLIVAKKIINSSGVVL
jgi:5'-3' exonuclease